MPIIFSTYKIKYLTRTNSIVISRILFILYILCNRVRVHCTRSIFVFVYCNVLVRYTESYNEKKTSEKRLCAEVITE